MPKELKQKSRKNNWFNKYKEKVINKEKKKIEQYKEVSGSWIFYDRFLGVLMDIIMWVIIGFFIYGWWITRGETIGCERITPDLCNYCFNQNKLVTQTIVDTIRDINNISIIAK